MSVDALQTPVSRPTIWRLTSPLIGERPTEDLLRLSLAALEGEDGPRVLLEAIEKNVVSLARS